jgi:hypothetical protein
MLGTTLCPQVICCALQAVDDATEKLRSFAEECDVLEGFQIICDPSTPWAGVCAATLDDISDDFASQPRITFAARGPRGDEHLYAMQPSAASPNATSPAAVSSALSMARWVAASALVVPMQAPVVADTGGEGSMPPAQRLRYDEKSPFHVAALAATAIDCATLAYRFLPETRPAPPGLVRGTSALYFKFLLCATIGTPLCIYVMPFPVGMQDIATPSNCFTFYKEAAYEVKTRVLVTCFGCVIGWSNYAC